MRVRSAASLVLLALAVTPGCVELDDESEGDGTSEGELYDECSSSSECVDDLFCPKSGRFKGLCSAECEDDRDCALRVGDEYYCLNGVCATACNDGCGFGAKISSCGAGFSCVSQSVIDGMLYSCDVSWCVPR
jgi:hypothetical protein